MLIHQRPPFPGITPEGLQFLRDLRENNEREWFKPRKHILEEEILEPLRCLIDDFSRHAAERSIPLTGDATHSIFRIYRDVRFSKNRQPYKNHVGLVFTPSGDKKDPGGLYLHVAPGGSFMASGFWNPDSKLLRRWRTSIVDSPETWFEVVEALERADLKLSDDDRLKRMPQGFHAHADSEAAPWLRLKSFTTSRPLSDDALLEPLLTDELMDFAMATRPLLEFGWQLEEHPGDELN